MGLLVASLRRRVHPLRAPRALGCHPPPSVTSPVLPLDKKRESPEGLSRLKITRDQARGASFFSTGDLARTT